MSNNWCDDDRATVYRSYTPARRVNNDYLPLGGLCKEILSDIDKNQSQLLWNEVEHVNYHYEIPVYQNNENNEVNDNENKVQQNADEVNQNCLDVLVKNQTAYT